MLFIFLNKNDRKLENQQDIHSKRLFIWTLKIFKLMSHDADKVIFNYSYHVLIESDKFLICEGLNLAILPKTLEFADYLLPFELLIVMCKT